MHEFPEPIDFLRKTFDEMTPYMSPETLAGVDIFMSHFSYTFRGLIFPSIDTINIINKYNILIFSYQNNLIYYHRISAIYTKIAGIPYVYHEVSLVEPMNPGNKPENEKEAEIWQLITDHIKEITSCIEDLGKVHLTRELLLKRLENLNDNIVESQLDFCIVNFLARCCHACKCMINNRVEQLKRFRMNLTRYYMIKPFETAIILSLRYGRIEEDFFDKEIDLLAEEIAVTYGLIHDINCFTPGNTLPGVDLLTTKVKEIFDMIYDHFMGISMFMQEEFLMENKSFIQSLITLSFSHLGKFRQIFLQLIEKRDELLASLEIVEKFTKENSKRYTMKEFTLPDSNEHKISPDETYIMPRNINAERIDCEQSFYSTIKLLETLFLYCCKQTRRLMEYIEDDNVTIVKRDDQPTSQFIRQLDIRVSGEETDISRFLLRYC